MQLAVTTALLATSALAGAGQVPRQGGFKHIVPQTDCQAFSRSLRWVQSLYSPAAQKVYNTSTTCPPEFVGAPDTLPKGVNAQFEYFVEKGRDGQDLDAFVGCMVDAAIQDRHATVHGNADLNLTNSVKTHIDYCTGRCVEDHQNKGIAQKEAETSCAQAKSGMTSTLVGEVIGGLSNMACKGSYKLRAFNQSRTMHVYCVATCSEGMRTFQPNHFDVANSCYYVNNDFPRTASLPAAATLDSPIETQDKKVVSALRGAVSKKS